MAVWPEKVQDRLTAALIRKEVPDLKPMFTSSRLLPHLSQQNLLLAMAHALGGVVMVVRVIRCLCHSYDVCTAPKQRGARDNPAIVDRSRGEFRTLAGRTGLMELCIRKPHSDITHNSQEGEDVYPPPPTPHTPPHPYTKLEEL